MSELPPEPQESSFPDSSTDHFAEDSTGELSTGVPLSRLTRRNDLGQGGYLPELGGIIDYPSATPASAPESQAVRSETPATFERLKGWRTGRSSLAIKKNLGRDQLAGVKNRAGMSARFKAEITSSTTYLPEREPLETPLAYINRCMALTPEEKTALDTAIDGVRQQMTSLFIDNPEATKEVDTYAATTRWKLAGGYQDKLPDGFYRDRSTQSITSTEFRDIQLFDAFMQATKPHVERVKKLSQMHADTLTQVGIEAIQQSNSFGLLESFAVNHAPKSERPLNATERAVRESILGSEIIHTYKIFPHELGRLTCSISESAGPAYIAYKRGHFMLDEARVPDEAAANQLDDDVAYANLRQWALGQAAAIPEDKVRSIRRQDGHPNEDYLQTVALYDVPNYTAENLDGENHHAFLVTIIKSMIRHAFDPKNTIGYHQALASAITTAGIHLKKLFVSMHATLETSQATNSELAWIRKTDCSALRDTQYDHRPKQNRLPISANGMHSSETIADKRQIQIGEIHIDNRTPEEREHTHLIFEAPYQQLPPQIEQQPAITVLWGSAERPFSLHDASLHIPGFIAVAARQENQGVAFDFLRDPKGSPYTNPGLPLTEGQQRKIASTYMAAGATKLSESLTTSSPKDLRGVAKIARQNSSYFIPHENMSSSYLVREGNLLAQCQGAAELGSSALANAGILNRVVKGAILPSTGQEITLVGHAQVITAAADTINIIDFTPSEEGGADVLTSTRETQSPPKVPDHAEAKQQVAALPSQEQPGENPQQEASRLFTYSRRSLQRTHAAFESRLTHNMSLPQHTPREIVYEKLAGLLASKPQDFWWQAASTLFRCQTVLLQYDEKGNALEAADSLSQLADELNALALTLKSALELPADERRKFTLFSDLSGLRSLEATAVKAHADAIQLTSLLRTIHQPSE